MQRKTLLDCIIYVKNDLFCNYNYYYQHERRRLRRCLIIYFSTSTASRILSALQRFNAIQPSLGVVNYPSHNFILLAKL